MLNVASLLLFVASVHRVVGDVGECVDVSTSEGIRTLQHGKAACAPLLPSENQDEKGKRFITCSNGVVYVQLCSTPLRFHTVQGGCTWPDQATCRLEEVSNATSTALPSLTEIIKPASATSTAVPNPSTTSTRQPQPSGPCNEDTCKLPDCFCYGSRPKIPVIQTPMFVMLTFDDAVTAQLYNAFFRPLVVNNNYDILNPNGCPISTAFYVNHDYTDYGLVKSLANSGNEIASHTISHSLPLGDATSEDLARTEAEIVGMLTKVLQGTGDKNISDSMVGFRAPYLRCTEYMYEVLRSAGFLYDTSVTNVETYSGRHPLWPFTLDFVMPRCSNAPCPKKPYPKVWEVPINGWMGTNGYPCSLIDVCTVGESVFTATEDEWYNFYKMNFERYFYPVKVPMHMFTHGSMFLRSEPSFPALIRLFKYIQRTYPDVWIVSPKMVIEWMQNPLTNSQMIASKWGCQRK